MANKKCTRCGIEKPEDGFHMGRRGRRKSCCKECHRRLYGIQSSRKKAAIAKERLLADRATQKRTCAICAGLIDLERSGNAKYCGPNCKEAGRDRGKKRAKRRRHYLKYRDRTLKYQSERRLPYAQWTPQKREAHRLAKVRARRKAGIQPREPKLPNLWEQNAKQAWAWWLKTCPDWWMRAYWRAQGRPWSNPRLTNGQAWRIRYWLDPEFRAKQIEKVQHLKRKRAARIAANNDGTLTGRVIVSLFAKAKHCPYCHKTMRSVDKSLDHVVPLSRGGAHSLKNVLVCCKPCNFKKGAKPIGIGMLAGAGLRRMLTAIAVSD